MKIKIEHHVGVALKYAIGESSGYSDNPIRYSGRMMYGAECVAIVTDCPANCTAKLILYLMQVDNEDLAELLCDEWMRTDDFGRRSVVYWPTIQWPDDLVIDGEEEDDD